MHFRLYIPILSGGLEHALEFVMGKSSRTWAYEIGLGGRDETHYLVESAMDYKVPRHVALGSPKYSLHSRCVNLLTGLSWSSNNEQKRL